LLYIANVDETMTDELAGMEQAVKRQAARDGAEFVRICAKLEDELAALPDAEAAEYRQALGVEESGLNSLIRASYHLLNLVTFFTATGEKEVRAWTIVRGTKAPQAAGKVHSDMEKGFIRAEVVAFSDLDVCGSFAAARERGLVRLEGRDYIVQDGDVIHFRFSPP
jgi:hypothetical protein